MMSLLTAVYEGNAHESCLSHVIICLLTIALDTGVDPEFRSEGGGGGGGK